MENASKALIIAGAILISIVLITLGVVILQQGQNTVNNSNMDDFKIQQFNSKFTQYCGDKVTGDKVNALIEAVISNNIVARRDDEEGKVICITATGTGIKMSGFTFPSATSGLSGTRDASNVEQCYVTALQKKAESGKVYKVSVARTRTDTGYIQEIKVEK